MIYFGTSGFSYSDWIGIVYPHDMPKTEWLRYYAHEFSSLELNSTYYAIPSLQTIESLVARTGNGFQFAVKANQEITHNRMPDDDTFQIFIRMLQPIIDAGKFGCILAEFPYSFHNTLENIEYIEYVRGNFGDLPLVVEFRNIDWLKPKTFEWLKRHNIGFCCVDEPELPNLIPPVTEITSSIAYVRFHGRNVAKWWQHDQAYERYDYTYSAGELSEWVPKIVNLNNQAEKTFVFANNHWQGQSVDTIRQLRLMIEKYIDSRKGSVNYR